MIKENIKGYELLFETNADCFSPKYIDRGTLAMLSFVDFKEDDKILDLGCGYGVVGVLAAKVTNPKNVFMTDVKNSIVEISKANAKLNNVADVNIIKSNAYESLDEAGFNVILSNPPYHTDFSIAKTFIEKGFNRLLLGGKFYMVTKRRQWYKNKFISIFGGVIIHEKDGYYIFEAEKRDYKYSNIKR
ncbi:MAG: methyltransferase [Defluviitaleaceae bacterium]|nr:methyltransferase [Defluviitaleaceae bacterium]